MLLAPAGVVACFRPLTDASLFLLLYGVTAVYFSGVMVRLIGLSVATGAAKPPLHAELQTQATSARMRSLLSQSESLVCFVVSSLVAGTSVSIFVAAWPDLGSGCPLLICCFESSRERTVRSNADAYTAKLLPGPTVRQSDQDAPE